MRVIGFGGKYEILSGHRRMEALKFNGESEADVRIIKCTDTEAANIVIKSNLLQRDKILPSERAKMYVLRNEYLKKDKIRKFVHRVDKSGRIHSKHIGEGV